MRRQARETRRQMSRREAGRLAWHEPPWREMKCAEACASMRSVEGTLNVWEAGIVASHSDCGLGVRWSGTGATTIGGGLGASALRGGGRLSLRSTGRSSVPSRVGGSNQCMSCAVVGGPWSVALAVGVGVCENIITLMCSSEVAVAGTLSSPHRGRRSSW